MSIVLSSPVPSTHRFESPRVGDLKVRRYVAGVDLPFKEEVPNVSDRRRYLFRRHRTRKALSVHLTPEDDDDGGCGIEESA